MIDIRPYRTDDELEVIQLWKKYFLKHLSTMTRSGITKKVEDPTWIISGWGK